MANHIDAVEAERLRDELVSAMVEGYSFNAFRLIDHLAGMRRAAYWPREDEPVNRPRYNKAQHIYMRELWRTQYPNDGCATLDDALQSIAFVCYDKRNDDSRTGTISGESGLVECYPVTDFALTWIARQMPALTILHALEADEYKAADPTPAQVETIARDVLRRGGRGGREDWIAEWWQTQMRYYAREFELQTEAAAQKAISKASDSNGSPTNDDMTP